MAEEDPVGQTRLLAEVKAAGLGDGNPKQITWPSRLGETLHWASRPCMGIKCGLGQDRTTSGQHSQWKRKLRFGIWNIKAINGKEIELIQEMKDRKIEILGPSEVNKRRKWNQETTGWIYFEIFWSRNG